MSEWKEYKLGDVVQSISETYQFESGEKVVFLNTSDILDGHFLTDAKTEASTLPGQAKKRIRRGDILFSEIRPANRRFAMVNFDCDDYVVSTKLMVLRCKDKIDNRFLYLFLTSKDVLEYLQMVAEDRSGTFPQITFDIIANMDISLPPIEEQKRIAGVLSSLDDKIDLLNRENATLEALAETLFRHYFIENTDLTRKDGKLGDILSVKGGTTPSTNEPRFWNGNIAWTSPRDVTTLNGMYLFKTERTITEEGLAKISSGLLPAGTLLMSSRAPVGVLAFAEIPVAINQGYIAIIDDKGYPKEFIYLWLKENMEAVHSYSNGSTFMEISKTAFKSLDITIPDKETVSRFTLQIKPIFEKIKSNQQQILTLTAYRDTLLPRLMSGEVKVIGL